MDEASETARHVRVAGRPRATRTDRDGSRSFVPNALLLGAIESGEGPRPYLGLVRAAFAAGHVRPSDMAEFLACVGRPLDEVRGVACLAGDDFLDHAVPGEAERSASWSPPAGWVGPVECGTTTWETVPEGRVATIHDTFRDRDWFDATSLREARDSLVPRRLRGNDAVRLLASLSLPSLDLPTLFDRMSKEPGLRGDYVEFLAMTGPSVADFLDDYWANATVVDDGLPDFLPDPSFTSVNAKWKGQVSECRHEMGLMGALSDEVLQSTPLDGAGYGNLMAYMYRRFGQPTQACDAYKNLHPSWMLTTPREGLYLLVRPSVSGSWDMFVPYLEGDPRKRERLPGQPADVAKALRDAYRAALLDLLRPVGVRDSLINALGVAGDETRGEWDEDEDDDKPTVGLEVEPHPSAGKVVPRGLLGTDEWDRVADAARFLGGGDMLAGMDKVSAILAGPLADEVRALPGHVRALAIAASFGPNEARQRLVDASGLEPGDPCVALVARAVWGRYEDGDDEAMPVFAEADVRLAGRVAGAYGLPFKGDELLERWEAAKRDRKEAVAFLAVAGGEMAADYPDAALPRMDFPNSEDVAVVPALLREAGRDDVAAYAERLLAEDDGGQVLAMLLYNLARYRDRDAAGEDGPPEAGVTVP